MKISPTKRYAVLTGDIVGSSKLPKTQRQTLPAAIKRAARQTRKAFPEVIPLDIEVFRGDSWQLLVSDPVRSLRVALFLRACLRSGAQRGRGLDTRVSLGIGPIDFVPASKVSEGDGVAYRASGAGLEKLPSGRFLAFSTSDFDQPGRDTIIGLIDAIIQDWTGKQALAVAGALRGWTQEKTAAAWPETISQQAITKHLAAAHWDAVGAALMEFERALSEAGAK